MHVLFGQSETKLLAGGVRHVAPQLHQKAAAIIANGLRAMGVYAAEHQIELH